MDLTLTSIERRVLGVLMEKALTQPDSYPMTSNAIVAGCNQKQNRSPLMNVDEDQVLSILDRLRTRSLVTLVFPTAGARVNRYRHNIEEQLGWVKAQRAIMAELLLRGPQTIGELRQRAGRMNSFTSLDAVSDVLDQLAAKAPPLVAALAREPGKSAVRYSHLLYEEEEQPQSDAPMAAGRPGIELQADSNQELAVLREEVQELRKRLEHLEQQLL